MASFSLKILVHVHIYLDTGSHEDKVGAEITVPLRMILNFRYSCLYILGARIAGLSRYTKFYAVLEANTGLYVNKASTRQISMSYTCSLVS